MTSSSRSPTVSAWTACIATDYEEEEGLFTGNLIGKWLWGPDKAEAVKAFCEREDIDLDESYAYTDSYYDRPLLEMVGYPRVVNPDALLRAYAVRKGWPVLGLRHEGMPKMAPEVYDLSSFAHPLIAPVNVVAEGVRLVHTEPIIIAADPRRTSTRLLLRSWRAAEVRHELVMLTTDADFSRIARHSALKVWKGAR